MKVIHKHLLALLFLNIICVILISVIGTRFGFSLKRNTLQSSIRVLSGPYGMDSWTPMNRAWQYWLKNNKAPTIYSDLLIRDRIKFQYPPNTLLLNKYILEWGIDPSIFFTIATRISLAITMIGVAAVALYSLKSFDFKIKPYSDKILLFVLIGLLTLTYYPILKACLLGQIQAWLNALFAIALLCYITGRMTLAGIIIGIMASIKPQYGLFVIWGLIRGNWRLTTAIIFSGTISVLIGISEFGISTYVDYLKGLSFLSKHGEAYMANQSVNGLINRFFSISDPASYNNDYWRRDYPPYNSWVYYGTIISSMVIVALCLVGGKNKTGYSANVDFCLMALGATMASPIAWEHHYGIMLPIFAMLWPFFWLSKTRFNSLFFQVVFLGLYLISSNIFPFISYLAPTYLNFIQSYLLFAAMGLFLLQLKVRQSGYDSPAAFAIAS